MRPDWRILVDGQDRSGVFRERLLALVVKDESGYHSDTVSLRLDDRGGEITLPRLGAEMEVQLGYRESGRASMGRYTIDETEMSGPPDTLLVRGKSIDMFASLKQHKTRSWSGDLSILVGTIAEEHNLEARVSSTLASRHIPHIDQTEESDLHFLTRLGQRYDAVVKPSGSVLYMVSRGDSVSATGRSVTPVSLRRDQTSQHRVTLSTRNRYQSVLANYHDAQEGKPTRVRVGQGTPSYTLRDPYPTADEARSAAATKLQSLRRSLAKIDLTVTPGDPRLGSGSLLTLIGFRSGVDGIWSVTKTTHELTQSGYQTRVTGETPTATAA